MGSELFATFARKINMEYERSNECEKIIEKVEAIICPTFNVSEQEIVNKNHKRDSSIARGFVWYILHYVFHLPISQISEIYFRSPRGVKAHIARTKELLKRQRIYENIYLEIKSKLR